MLFTSIFSILAFIFAFFTAATHGLPLAARPDMLMGRSYTAQDVHVIRDAVIPLENLERGERFHLRLRRFTRLQHSNIRVVAPPVEEVTTLAVPIEGGVINKLPVPEDTD